MQRNEKEEALRGVYAYSFGIALTTLIYGMVLHILLSGQQNSGRVRILQGFILGLVSAIALRPLIKGLSEYSMFFLRPYVNALKNIATNQRHG